jgi:hypothetical protein
VLTHAISADAQSCEEARLLNPDDFINKEERLAK